MCWTHCLVAASTVSIVLASASVARSQDVVLPGSTAQGDILRGEGQFLKGAAWYEFNAAKAREIDARTAIEIDKWNREVFEAYQRERADRVTRRVRLTKAQTEAAQAKMIEREARLRTSPNLDDISNGDALNAMLVDLSDPTIPESSWRVAGIPLSRDLSIKSLIFRFTPRPGDKHSQTLSRGVIALARLDVAGRWPSYLSVNALASERTAYEAAYGKIRDQSLAGRLDIDTVIQMDAKVEALRHKVSQVVPTERAYRATAVRFVQELKKATGMFDAETVDFASEIISDTQKHDAQTVGELLAFMRKYRLMFSPADGSPGVASKYGLLYGLMRQQKQALGLPATPAKQVANTSKEEAKKLQGVWSLKSNEMNGRILPQVPSEKFSITFEADKFTVHKDGQFWHSGPWKVNPSEIPHHIDLVITEGRDKGKVWLGIYVLDGDTLRVHIGKARPHDFGTVAGAGNMLLYYLRALP